VDCWCGEQKKDEGCERKKSSVCHRGCKCSGEGLRGAISVGLAVSGFAQAGQG
jgi:hypothetical protein